MWQHLPDRATLMFFAVLAVICAAIVMRLQSTDVGLSLLSMPVFFVAAVLGLRQRYKDPES